MTRTVSIVAQGASLLQYVNECTALGGMPPTDDVWAINAVGNVIKHDLLFAMDDCRVQESRPNKNIRRMLKWLKAHPGFYTSKVYPEYPGAVEYPLEEVAQNIGIPYFNGTVAYAVALAIAREYAGISIYGADFSYAHVHKAERGRACVEFLLGIAMSRGISVHLPHTTTLMDTCEDWSAKCYGQDAYDIEWEVTPDGLKLHRADKPLPSGEYIEELYLTKERQNARAMGT